MFPIDPHQSYSYSRYSELRIDPIDLCEYFSYPLELQTLELASQIPESLDPIELASLKRRITAMSTRLISRNEQAKREMLIAPIIEFVVESANALIRIEYPINVSTQLQGTVDYLLSIDNLQQLLVIEAKRDDLDYGFTQLMAEMIALDRWERSPSVKQQPILLGAISTGSIWQFARLDRTTQVITQGINSCRSPEDLDLIVAILIHGLDRNRN